MAQRIIEYSGETFHISYEKIPALRGEKLSQDSELAVDSKQGLNPPIFVFLHGWGSNKELMKIAFGQYFRDYEHIYIDMPGFGDSPNDKALHTDDYARIIERFLQDVCKKEARECVLIGHSFGGKVAILTQPKELILLSSAGIKVAKSLRVLCKIGFAKILGKLGLARLGKIFRSSDVGHMNEGMYQTFKNVVDEDFSSHFSSYNGRVSIFWGKDDQATPLACGEKIAQITQTSRFFIMNGDHYFFLKQGAEIERLYKQEW